MEARPAGSTPAPALAVHEGGKQISALDSAVRSYTHQVVAEVAAATPVTVQGEGTALGADALALEPDREAALPRAQVCATAFAVAVTPGSPWDAFAENVAKPLSAARAAAMSAAYLSCPALFWDTHFAQLARLTTVLPSSLLVACSKCL